MREIERGIYSSRGFICSNHPYLYMLARYVKDRRKT